VSVLAAWMSSARKAGDAIVAGDADDGLHEPVVSVAVHRRREPQHGRADAAVGQGERQLRGVPPVCWPAPICVGAVAITRAGSE
jgi:hypothetical protein